MPRPLVGEPQALNQPLPEVKLGSQARPSSPERRVHLRPRPTGLLDSLAKIENVGATGIDLQNAIQSFKAAFPLDTAVPLGILAVCHLGSPYEVHVLDLVGNIVHHYKTGEPLPHPYAGARRLALHPSYCAIEVYEDRYVCIHLDSAVTEVPQ